MAREQRVDPPQAQCERDLALVEHATAGDQQRQVRHIKKNRRQQLEEATLTRVDP